MYTLLRRCVKPGSLPSGRKFVAPTRATAAARRAKGGVFALRRWLLSFRPSRAVAADRSVSEVLGVAEGKALLSVERITYTYGDKPVEWRRGLYLTDDHFYLNELS